MKTILIISFAFGSSAFAVLKTDAPRGREIIKYQHDGKSPAEICVLPKHFPAVSYLDKDEEKEKELCDIDFHAANSDEAICPKLNSTNPGIDIFKLPNGQSKAQFESRQCALVDKKDVKKIAKYKVSTSCSYTPSILGYYHLSRILGGAANVPQAVLRTMDKGTHLEMAVTAERLTRNKNPAGPDPLIHQTWSTLLSGLKSSVNEKNGFYLTDNSQSFGAIVVNPSKEEKYNEFFNGGTDRSLAFRDRNPYYQDLKKPVPVKTFVGKTLNAANLQKIVALKDASEMIIMDHLMNQADRFGNIHYLEHVYYTKPGDNKFTRVKADKTDMTQLAGMSPMKIKEMVLKDNDCGGFRKTNKAKETGLIRGINHMNKQTYHRLLWLDSVMGRPETKNFLFNELVFTPADYSMLSTNLKEVVTQLQARCRAGQLHLDLDPLLHFFGDYQPSRDQCELPQ